jgi:hypothetical protein
MTDLERGAESPVTSGRLTEVFGRWLPDQQGVIYSIAAGTPPNLTRRDLASGAETPLLPPGTFQNPQDVSPDGRTLLFLQRSGTSAFDLWTLPLVGEGAAAPFVASPAVEGQAAFSPDGRFVALITNETERSELYVTPFPGPGEKIRVSTDGARVFRWARASRELVYLTFDRRVISVPVQTDPTLRLGEQSTLFILQADVDWRNFDVTSDGARFLALLPVVVADEAPITVITDWRR